MGMLPVPAISTQEQKAASFRVFSALSDSYTKGRFSGYGETYISSLGRRLDNYSPEVIGAFERAIIENPGKGFEELLVSALHQRAESGKAGLLLFIAQHDEEQDVEWSPDDQVSYNYERALDRYNGIMSLDGRFGFEVPDDIYATDDSHSTAVISALVKVTSKVYDKNEWDVEYVTEPESGYTLKDDSLIELIVRRPEDADQIADIVTSRDNPDAGMIEALLDAEVPALRDGMV